jgi:predicted deacylase
MARENMRVEQLGAGRGEPIAIVTCLHGKERCGKAAMEALLDPGPSITGDVRFVVANERAMATPDGPAQYLDDDLNRSFPGDPDSESHERRLAAELLAEVRDCRVLDVHSTLSDSPPFALFLPENDRRLVAATGVDIAVDVRNRTGRGALIEFVNGVSVECGLRGTQSAVDNARKIIRNFLAALGAIEAEFRWADPEVYEITDTIDCIDCTFEGENFTRVDAGEQFASRNGRAIRASEPFYPVLTSRDGYEEMLGYRAEKRGRLSMLE